MNIIAVQSSNRPDGLTASLAKEVLAGATEATDNAGKCIETAVVDLNSLKINVCRACGERGWGQCREGRGCIQDDDFTQLYERICRADALVFASPVYFGDLSESAKTFLDRLRRQEWSRKEAGRLRGKPVVGIMAAGGSGNGPVNAVRSLENYMTYIGMSHVIYLPTSRQNQGVQFKAAREAGRHLAGILLEGHPS
ncbi:MAG: flavodoxin family protein [Bacillota bacterium]|nr:flavodoxin family protein [Bacillota bacterium]